MLVTNWHVFEPQGSQRGRELQGDQGGRRPSRPARRSSSARKTTTARGSRYLTQEDFDAAGRAGDARRPRGGRDNAGNLKKVLVESVRYVESDTALVNRILGREVGGKQNILVINDEAHHAYRIKRDEADDEQARAVRDEFEDEEDAEEFFEKEATVWIDGLDRIHKLRGINFCIDLSATPYFLGSVGQETNRPFPWVVSDFGLIDAIESGLVKIPQLAVRDTTGAEIPGYFNIWHWILPKLTPAERGGKRANPEARGDPQVGAHADRHAGRALGGHDRENGPRERRATPAGLHPRLQEHGDRQGRLRVARRGQGPDGHPARQGRRRSATEWGGEHDPRGLQGGARDRHRRGQERRDAVDAVHPRHRREDRLAARTARAGRSTPTASRNWPRSSTGPSTRPVETCAASSASAC